MKNRSLAIGLTALLGVAAASVSAEELDTRWYIAPAVSWMVADDNRHAKDDVALSVSVGKALSERWNLDFRVFWDDLDRDAAAGGGDYEQYGAGIDALMFWSRSPSFSPFLIVGVNAINTEVNNGGDETNPGLDLGLGFLRQINETGMALRSEVRYRKDFDNDSVPGKSHSNDWLFTVGLNIPFGPAPVAPPAEEAPPVQFVEVDFDNDGVEDSIDKCPNTPPGTTVDEFGCPLHVAPAPVAVKEVIILEGVNFEFDSAKLTPEAKEILKNDTNALLNSTDDKAILDGHTDSIGPAAYNQGLSERRAASVKAYLVEGGIDPERLTTEGHGESKPIADNTTKEGRAKNRRVELKLLED
ncbi:MAG: OmpA family protein [Gammaproteobacteria bacterium]|nr:OmpA family protein [Gammaproteobacteria bacterium]